MKKRDLLYTKSDYIVVPQANGQLLLIDEKVVETSATLLKGQSYYRKAGSSHNVINNGDEKLVFIEIEMKAHTI